MQPLGWTQAEGSLVIWFSQNDTESSGDSERPYLKMSDVEQQRETHEVTTGLHVPCMAHTLTHACTPIGLPQQQQQKNRLNKHALYKANY